MYIIILYIHFLYDHLFNFYLFMDLIVYYIFYFIGLDNIE